MAKKKKVNGKAVAIAVGVLAVLGGIMSLGDEKEPEPTQEPVRAVVTAPPTAGPTPSPVPTPTPYRIHGVDAGRTVYVSSSGVIHLDKDCSGMKNYTEMTMEQADAAGYRLCERCG